MIPSIYHCRTLLPFLPSGHGGRSSRTEDRAVPGRNMPEPGRNSFRPPGRRTELAPSSRTEDGAVVRFRTPRTEAEIEDGGQDGGPCRGPGRNPFRSHIPSSRTEVGDGGNSFLRPPGRNRFPSSVFQDGGADFGDSSVRTPHHEGVIQS
eukprot:gene11571-biopygen5633